MDDDKKNDKLILLRDDCGEFAVRARGGEITVHDVTFPKHGQPIGDDVELVSLKEDGQGLYDVEVLRAASSGRSRSSTRAYRSGWDTTFGGRGAQKAVN